MRNTVLLPLVLLLSGLSVIGNAQSALIGAGYFRPSNGLMQDLFGNQLKFSPSLGSLAVSPDWKLKPSVSMVSARKDGNKFAVIPFSLSLERAFAPAISKTVPYVKLGAGPNYVDYAFDTGGVHYAAKKVSWGGSLEAGLILNTRFLVSARYDAFSKVDGFDFSGLTLSAQYSVYSF